MRCHVLEQFEHAWRSRNHEKKDTLHTEIQTLLTRLDRERRRSRVILTICSVYSLVSLIGAGFILSTRDVRFSETWPLVLAQSLALLVLAYLVRTRFVRSEREPTSVRDAAASALAHTRSGIATLKLIAIAMGAMMTLLTVAVAALSSSGKMDAQSVSSFAAVCLLIVIFNASIFWLKWRRILRPRQDRLNAILRDLDSQ